MHLPAAVVKTAAYPPHLKNPIGSSFHSQPHSVQLGNRSGDGARSGEEKAPREAGKWIKEHAERENKHFSCFFVFNAISKNNVVPQKTEGKDL